MMRNLLFFLMATTILLQFWEAKGMNILAVQDDQNWSDGSPVGFGTVDFTTFNGVMRPRHLLSRQLSLNKQQASQYDPKSSSSIPDIYLLVVVVNLWASEFNSQQQNFLREIAANTKKSGAVCSLFQLNQHKVQQQTVEIYCQHSSTKSKGVEGLKKFLSGEDLVAIFNSGHMRAFLQKYNVAKYYSKNNMRKLSVPYHITNQVWFPVAACALATFLFIVMMAIILCCLKRSKCKRDSKKLTDRKRDSLVCHSIKPIETMSPTMVQPQVKDLYTVGGSPRRVQKWNGERDHKRPGLLQSRRGSQASLIIDVTPFPKESFAKDHESPTEESLSALSKYLTFRDLEDEKDNQELLFREFWAIPTNSIPRKDQQSMSNASLKNRYPDYIPNPKTAVRLKEINGDSNSTYINANFIRGRGNIPNVYIAAEGPLQSTMGDFWRMIWEQNCPIIVMITKLKERNEEKCAPYWPTSSTVTQQQHGEITVTRDSEIDRGGYVITKLYISHGKFLEESRLVTHYWMTSWPDHKVPKSTVDTISLARDVRSALDISRHNRESGPVVVHCSAGRGRTGSFIAICHAMEQIEDEHVCNILKIVSSMRLDRGGMVQKDEQYIFIHRTIFEYWNGLKSPSPTLSSILPAGVEDAQEAKEEDNEFNGRHFVW